MFDTKDLFATKLDFGSKYTLESDREKMSSFCTPRISDIL